jgi:hypothetical protein
MDAGESKGVEEPPPVKKEERKKVPLAPGHTLNDWLRILRSGRNLSGLESAPGTGIVTMEQLRQHKVLWMSVCKCVDGHIPTDR